MGLDNGIMLKAPLSVLKENKYPIPITERDVYESDIEICYWRKCWGIRNQIIKHLGENIDKIYYPLVLNDIEQIINILVPFGLSEEYWDNEAQSIWDYNEYLEVTCRYIVNLHWLKWFMTQYPEYEVYFYDSY
jgi:hypothetical protein